MTVIAEKAPATQPGAPDAEIALAGSAARAFAARFAPGGAPRTTGQPPGLPAHDAHREVPCRLECVRPGGLAHRYGYY